MEHTDKNLQQQNTSQQQNLPQQPETSEKPFKYVDTVRVKTYHADFTRTLAPTSVFGFMQELATVHAEKLGLGYEDSKANGFYWVIGRSKYVFTKLPTLFEEVEVITWPAGVDGLCALRRFEFRIGGRCVGEGFTYWLMLDSTTLRPVKPAYFFEMTKDLPIQESDHFKLKKEPIPVALNPVYQRVMRSSDLDWNNHVNNLKFAELIYDALPTHLLQRNHISSMQINYLKEIMLTESVEIFAGQHELTWYVEGRVQGRSAFTASVVLEPIHSAPQDPEKSSIHSEEQILDTIKGTLILDFTKVKKQRTMASLIDYQSRHKYLLMSLHQKNQKLLGKIVANHEEHTVAECLSEYEQLLSTCFSETITVESNINMLSHIFGYFKEQLSSEEKQLFLEQIDDFKKREITIDPLLDQLYTWSQVYQENYLLIQSVFDIYKKMHQK